VGPHPRNDELDILPTELGHELLESVGTRDIGVAHGLGVEHEPARRSRSPLKRLVDASFDVARVREEEAVVESVHDDTGSDARRRVELHVRIPPEPIHPAPHRVVRLCAPAHDLDDGEQKSEREGVQHSEDDDAGGRHGGDARLDAAHERERAPGAGVHETDREPLRNPRRALVPEKARSSRFARTCWPLLPTKVLAVRIPSA